jgi:hypothetical protein
MSAVRKSFDGCFEDFTRSPNRPRNALLHFMMMFEALAETHDFWMHTAVFNVHFDFN